MLTKVLNKTFKKKLDKKYKVDTGMEIYFGQKVHLDTARTISDNYLEWLFDKHEDKKVRTRLHKILKPFKQAVDKEDRHKVTIVTVVSYLLCVYNVFKTQEALDKWFKKFNDKQMKLM